MTPPRLLAVFTALALIGAPLQVFASEDLSLFSGTTSTIAITLPIQETVSSTESLSSILLETVSTSTISDLASPFLASSTNVMTTSSNTLLIHTDTPSSTILSAPEEMPSLSTTTGTICLAIIAPYPDEGPEWIALYGLTPSSSHRLFQWSIHDAQSSLVKIVTSTPLLWDEPSKTLRFQLRSARLNNDGDTVTLKNSLGDVHDTFVYTEVERDQRWFRERCDAPWHIIPKPIIQYVHSPAPTEPTFPSISSSTPIANTSIAPEPPSMNVEQVSLPIVTPIIIDEELPTSPPPKLEPHLPLPIVKEERPPTGTILKASAQQPPANTPSPHTPKRALIKQAPTKRVSSPQKTTPVSSSKTSLKKSFSRAIPSLSMSTILDQPAKHQGVRVRISGIVASRKKLIGSHKFILLNSDGKGLLVHAKTTLPTPERGQRIQATGVLMWNDEGIWLKQQAQDAWEIVERAEEDEDEDFAIRIASIDEPSQEDAWSHIEVEGKVVAVQGESLDIETEDGVPLRVRLSKLIGYRAGRVEPRYTIRVRGLLDIRGTEPVLLPQVSEDVQILERAPLPSPQNQRPTQAPWLPVGVMAATLATTETLRRAKTWYKKHQEERAFAAFLQGKPQDIS